MSDPRLQKFKSRQRVNQIAIGLSMAAMAFGLVWLIWILWETFSRGVGGLLRAFVMPVPTYNLTRSRRPVPSHQRASSRQQQSEKKQQEGGAVRHSPILARALML